MRQERPRIIHLAKSVDVEVRVPPSKSYTNRALIVASLAEGASTLNNPSKSDDTELMIDALQEFGVKIQRRRNCLDVQGTAGQLQTPTKEICLGNAGTAMRFMTTFASLARGVSVLNGDEHMQRRPIKDLLDALRSAGIRCSSNNGYPPVKIQGGNFVGGPIGVAGSISSQFASSILLSAPYVKQDVVLRISSKLSSLPYVDMSLHVMRSFGADVTTIDPFTYHVSTAQKYIGQKFQIEGDASAATYFLAAAAITEGRVRITNLSPDSLQGDLKFLSVLAEMGCNVIKHQNGIEISGARLRGVEVDMNEIPDCVPTLSVVSAFADGPTAITNVGHLRYKETDRLIALSKELSKIGAKVELHDDGLVIHPQALRGAEIETYNDHRIAMSFAIAGLRVKGISIKNPSCVSKSFPHFWDEFKKFQTSE